MEKLPSRHNLLQFKNKLSDQPVTVITVVSKSCQKEDLMFHYILALFLLGSGLAQGQMGQGQMGQGKQARDERSFDPTSIVEVQGTIKNFVSNPSRHSPGMGWHLYLQADGREWFVHLGPQRFYDGQKIQLEKGMKVTIVGSKITFEGQEIIVAKEIKTDAGTIKVRDDQGKPYFSMGPGGSWN
jgi:hypothetical protein